MGNRRSGTGLWVPLAAILCAALSSPGRRFALPPPPAPTRFISGGFLRGNCCDSGADHGFHFRDGLLRGVLAGSLFASHPPDRSRAQAAVSRAMSSGDTVGCSRQGARP